MPTRARLMLVLLAAAGVVACGEDRAPEGAAGVKPAAASKTLHVQARGMVKKLGIT